MVFFCEKLCYSVSPGFVLLCKMLKVNCHAVLQQSNCLYFVINVNILRSQENRAVMV